MSMMAKTIQFTLTLFAFLLMELVVLINGVIPPPVQWWVGMTFESPRFHGAAIIKHQENGAITAYKWDTKRGVKVKMWERRG